MNHETRAALPWIYLYLQEGEEEVRTEFMIGDRVSGHACHTKGGVLENSKILKIRGVIERISDGIILVKFDKEVCGYSRMNFSPRSLRRLKPRAKPREFWIDVPQDMSTTPSVSVTFITPKYETGWITREIIHVREVRAKR